MRPELPPTNKSRKALDSMKTEDIDKEKSEMYGGSDAKKRRVQRCRDFKDYQTRVAELTTWSGEIGKHDQATGTSEAARRTTTPRNQIVDGMDKNNFRTVRAPVHEAVCEGWAKPVRRKRSVVTCKRALINQFNQNVNSNLTFGLKWTSIVNLFR